jgi:hypothetical protein
VCPLSHRFSNHSFRLDNQRWSRASSN